MLKVKLAGSKFGQQHWGLWDTSTRDFIRVSGLVEVRLTREAAEQFKAELETK